MENKRLHGQLYEFLSGKKPLEKDISRKYDAENKDFSRILHQLDKLSKETYFPDRERMWGKIYRHVVVRRHKLIIRRWRLVAAVLMPVFLSTVLFLYFQSSRTFVQPETAVIARNQVRLLLDDGRVVHVQQIGKDSVLNEKGVGIRIDTAQTIVYTTKNRQKSELIYNTLTVPRCCEYHLVLADGTQVWINSDSELKFPVDFVGKERRVFLKGEAYFQVAKNPEKPFRVETGTLQVEALGTGFDVRAYREEGIFTTTLVEGRVKVCDLTSQQQCMLAPGEQAQLQKGMLSTAKVKVEEVISWKEGRFVFSDMSLQEIARQLERWYDVKINFQDEIVKYYRFTGVMKRYNPLSRLMELIEETTNVKCQVNGREINVCRH